MGITNRKTNYISMAILYANRNVCGVMTREIYAMIRSLTNSVIIIHPYDIIRKVNYEE